MPSCLSFLLIFPFFQGVPVGLPASPAMGLPGMNFPAMASPVVPPASSCSGQLPVGIWCYFLWRCFVTCVFPCIDYSFCFFRPMCSRSTLVLLCLLRMKTRPVVALHPPGLLLLRRIKNRRSRSQCGRRRLCLPLSLARGIRWYWTSIPASTLTSLLFSTMIWWMCPIMRSNLRLLPSLS